MIGLKCIGGPWADRYVALTPGSGEVIVALNEDERQPWILSDMDILPIRKGRYKVEEHHTQVLVWQGVDRV